MKKLPITLLLFLSFIIGQFSLTSSFAAPAPIVPTALRPLLSLNLGNNINNEITGFSLGISDLALIGILGNETSTTIPIPGFGENDGLIADYDLSGALRWQTRLGTASDDLATAVCTLPNGSYLVAGVTATSTPYPNPSETSTSSPLNPDSVTVVAANQISYNQLNLWHLSNQGMTTDSQTVTLGSTIYPQKLLCTGNSRVLLGEITQNNKLKYFNWAGLIGADTNSTAFLTNNLTIQNTSSFSPTSNKITIPGKTLIINEQITKSIIFPKWHSKKPLNLIISQKKNKTSAAIYFPGQILTSEIAKDHSVYFLVKSGNNYLVYRVAN